jgi:ABC-type dipeptide/oligopeptide/nickel transport system permease component
MEIRKNGLSLPIIALVLDLAPVLILFLNSITWGFTAVALLFVVLYPIAGLITGIVTLTVGKGRIGKIGKILAIIAISLPAVFVAFILIIFIGVVTGVISLM